MDKTFKRTGDDFVRSMVQRRFSAALRGTAPVQRFASIRPISTQGVPISLRTIERRLGDVGEIVGSGTARAIECDAFLDISGVAPAAFLCVLGGEDRILTGQDGDVQISEGLDRDAIRH